MPGISFSSRSPLFAYILLQICFWAFLHIFLSLYLYLGFRFIISDIGASVSLDIFHILAYALFFALFHGVILGFISYFVDKLLFIAKSAGRIIALQIVVSIVVFIITFEAARDYTSDRFLPERAFSQETWRNLFYVLLSQYSFASFIVALANQTFRKYGRDVFLPLMMGVYRKPREEKRIFLFIDLKSSTTLAEKFGHVRYSSVVQEFMFDINKCLFEYGANIYQYAGDEVIVTWNTSRKNALQCIKFFFACRALLEKRSARYVMKYGVVPTFKAGVDCGIVTAVEIGDMKRDIAYHGDTVNTASRIQGLCSFLNKNFLVSKTFHELIIAQEGFFTESIGTYLLKGKETAVEIYSIAAGS